MVQVNVKGNIPQYAKRGDAGADLISAVDILIKSGKYEAVPTGTSIALPEYLVGLVHPRSGLAAKHGITVLNTPGTIDSGYRGEIKVLLYNTSDTDYWIAEGDRIAQLVIQEYVTPRFEQVEELDETDRGAGGFGSTGR